MSAHDEDGSVFLEHIACPNCGSSDANALYTDGHTHCHKCGHHTKPRGEFRTTTRAKPSADAIDNLTAFTTSIRDISPKTLALFSYQQGRTTSQGRVHVATHFDSTGNPVAQHIRTKDKSFWWTGDQKKAGLFGQHLWSSGGRRLVITEGELDAMSLSEVQENKWPVVSAGGTDYASKAVKRNLEWVASFEEVVLWFDADDQGKAAAQEVAALLPPRKAKIVTTPHPHKDANDMLRAGQARQMEKLVWNAKEYKPDGIVFLGDVVEDALTDYQMTLPWWDDRLNAVTFGRRPGVYTFGAGTGIGKTDWLIQQMGYDISVNKEPIGIFSFEQSPGITLRRIAGKIAHKPFHIPNAGWTMEERRVATESLREGPPVAFYNIWGSNRWNDIANSIRFLHHTHEMRLFYIDPLTALTAHAENEKTELEAVMADAARLAEELHSVLHLSCHLSRPSHGASHEEGGRVTARNVGRQSG